MPGTRDWKGFGARVPAVQHSTSGYAGTHTSAIQKDPGGLFGGGADAAESSDGLFVYYTKMNQRGIWRKPVAGGSESLVVPRGMPNLWSIHDNGLCVIDDAPGHSPSIDCLTFGSNRLSTVVKLPEKTRVNMSGPSQSVSADGQSFRYVVRDREEIDIMLARNLR